MKKLLLLALLLFLIGCGSSKEYTNDELWALIKNQEFTADNGWAGEGIYFYEEDSKQYCDYMIYGSGVPVAGLVSSEVSYDKDGNIIISLPHGWAIHDLNDTSTELDQITLVYTNGIFTWNDYVFEDMDLDLHDGYDAN